MNLLHLKYAVAVATYGSVNKAAEKLFAEAPNISRAIRGLEASAGVSLFRRSSKGMELTPDGKIFIDCAKNILRQVEEMEEMFQHGFRSENRLSVSAPPAGYIEEAFARFFRLTALETEPILRETNSQHTLTLLAEGKCRLGIIRCAEAHIGFCEALWKERGLTGEPLAAFPYAPVMSRRNPLSLKETVTREDLSRCSEIAPPDNPALTGAGKEKPEQLPCRRILVSERALQLELLTEHPDSFLWDCPWPSEALARQGLFQKSCEPEGTRYRDILVYPEDVKLSEAEEAFLRELRRVIQEVLG